MLMVATSRGARIAFCDRTCLQAAPRTLQIDGAVEVSTSAYCRSCFACELLQPGSECPCAGLGVSCCAPTWMLSAEAHECLGTLHNLVGPLVLSEQDWEQILALGEVVWFGGAVAVVWVRDTFPDIHF